MPRKDLLAALVDALANAVVERLEKGATSNPPKKRRRLSPAGRARIVAAAKKRWAEYRKAKSAQR